MKRDNDFYYFLAFITFYGIMLIWYLYYVSNYEEMMVPTYTERGFTDYTSVTFLFKVVLAFPLGIINWLKDAPLNPVFYLFGCIFYSFLLYRIYYRKVDKLLWFMLMLNVLAAIFFISFLQENPLIIQGLPI
ncbi:hypothetical protein V9K67_18020 [Paraflavisolibacter sp. H34]|uniref:hypothetical protein n=1 Tax=Huijunlia imazamoxiresistens TaxID=3127457 RepID=UPI00301663B8